MEREQLDKMKLEALRTLALEQGVAGASGMGRAQLIDQLAPPPRSSSGSEQPAAGSEDKSLLERAKEAVVGVAHRVEEKAHELAERIIHPDPVKDPQHAGATSTRAPRRPTGTPARAGFDIPSSTVHPHAEELETLTMARLYLAEGQLERALEIYEKLAAQDPEDEMLRAQLEDLRKKRGTVTPLPTPPPPSHGEPMFMLDIEELPETYGLNECEVLYKDPFWVFAYWEVTDEGLSSARAQLGPSAGESRLVMRLFTTVAGGNGVERQIHDIDLSWNHGRRYLQSPKPGAHLRIAVGLLSREGYFAPIAHSSLVRVPSPEPTEGPVEWMEVIAGKSRGKEKEALVIVRRGQQHVERGVYGNGRQPEPPSAGPPGASRGRWNPGSGSGGSGGVQ